MRELKGYQDPYQRRKTSAFSGPYRRSVEERVYAPLLAVIIGVGFALILFYGLSS